MHRNYYSYNGHVNAYRKYAILSIIDYYGAEKLRKFVQNIQSITPNNKPMMHFQAGGCYRDPLYSYIISLQHDSYKQVWINFGGIFPEKHTQIMHLVLEIKQSPFYMGYLEFINKHIIKQFDTLVQQHLHQDRCYQNILDDIETQYQLIEQSYKLYKFYIAFWLNSLYGMYSQVNFDINEFLTQIIERKLYTFGNKQSQTILSAFNEQEQITYSHNIFMFNFHEIDVLFDNLMSQWNERQYTNDNEYSGFQQLSLVDVVLNEFETISVINEHEIVHPFGANMVGMEHIFKKYDRTLFECSVCKNHYHQDGLFIYKCCNNYICPHCVYECNLQRISLTNDGFGCPCCNTDIRNVGIQGHSFCGNIPGFSVSALPSEDEYWDDDYQDDGYQDNEYQDNEHQEDNYQEDGYQNEEYQEEETQEKI